MAVIIPAEGGKPDAIEIPRQSGNAIKNTKKPDNKSLRQCATSPAKPVLGTSTVISFIIKISRPK